MREIRVSTDGGPVRPFLQAERYWRGPVRQGRSTMARTAHGNDRIPDVEEAGVR
jgi:hypothetical protein